MYLTQIMSPPAEEPVSLAETKMHLRILHNDEDSLLSAYISAARIMLESITNRRFITQTWKLFLEQWPADILVMPFGKLQAVESFRYRDENEQWRELITEADTQGTTANIIIDTYRDPGVVSLAHDAAWPSVILSQRLWPVKISFKCGYGMQAAIPQPLKIAVMQLAGHMYENRENTNEIPPHVSALINEYRIWSF